MNLYHITTKYTEELTPRVPKHTLKLSPEDIKAFGLEGLGFDEEDRTTKRICLSDSIEGCFMSTPWCIEYYDKWYEARHYEKYKENLKNLDDIYILEFNVDNIDGIIVKPEIVNKSYHVIDAIETNEHWVINCPKIKADKIYKVDKYSIILDTVPMCGHLIIGVYPKEIEYERA